MAIGWRGAILTLARRPTTGRGQTVIQAALNHFDSATEANGDVRGRSMEALSSLVGGEMSVKTQVDDLAIGFGKQNDYFPQQAKQLLFLSKSLRVPSRILHLLRQGFLPEPMSLAANILGTVGDDRVHPGTGLGAATAGPSSLQDLDPTLLKSVFGQTVVSSNPLGKGEETPRAAFDPFLMVTFQQGTGCGGVLEFRGGKNMKVVGHLRNSIFLGKVPTRGPCRR